jgi:antitoxin VapB
MALNIKSDEAHGLARRLAEVTESSMTEAVTVALRRTLDEETGASDSALLMAEVAEVQRFVADLPDRDTRSPDELLGYDDAGLPR